VVGRLERLPMSRWHLKARFIIGIATFFDGLDFLAIAYVLPVLAPMWHLTPGEIGLMLSASFGGQIFSALLFGWLAERHGRRTAIVLATALYSLMSFACAFSWNYTSLLVMRTIQGVGLGGEVAVAITYISEIAKAESRGRFMLLYEIVFPIGLVSAVLIGIWIMPIFGWQSMFIIGGLPAFLVVFIQRLLPESPRWLASRGRYAEADAATSFIEKEVERRSGPLAPAHPVAVAKESKASIRDLFGGVYLQRTLSVWAIWAFCYFCNFGLATWLPTLYRTTFRLDLGSALKYSLITQVVGLLGTLAAALYIDRFPRRVWFGGAFFCSAAVFLWLWYAPPADALVLAATGSLAYFFISTISIGVYLYTPEIYPTRVRALGVSTAACWSRAASFLGPNLVGFLIGSAGLGAVFGGFAAAAALGGAVCILFIAETRRRLLEEVSP
jgi:putative MFS transporter